VGNNSSHLRRWLGHFVVMAPERDGLVPLGLGWFISCRTNHGNALAKLICVEPKKVDLIWPEVSHWIRRAMERGDLGTFAQLEDDVLAGRALLWLSWHHPKIVGATVTQIGRTEKSKVCTILACVGFCIAHWIDGITKIEEYAKAEGCDAMRVMGRKGWARLLPDYSTSKVILEKRL
jgi:hypothetical protein